MTSNWPRAVFCLQMLSTEHKLSDITDAVLEVLQASCGECVSEMVIDNQFFVCYPESPSHVTYRARLEGTSERESGSLISLIEEWVRGGASVIVTRILMTVDPDCSVAISSLSEGECSPTTTTTKDETPSTVMIIAFAAGCCVLLTAIATMVVAVTCMASKKYSKQKRSLNIKAATKSTS